jgi:alpha-D-xyloside xylohydrolase
MLLKPLRDKHGQLYRSPPFPLSSAIGAVGALLPSVGSEGEPHQTSPGAPPITLEELPSAVVLHNGAETVRITVCAPDVIHIVAGQGNPVGASPLTPWFLAPSTPQHPEVVRTRDQATVRTHQLSVVIDLKTGLLQFVDPSGKTLLQECG